MGRNTKDSSRINRVSFLNMPTIILLKGVIRLNPQVDSVAKPRMYRSILTNRTLILLWSGGTISTIGDAFFNLAVMWVIYTSSHSFLQTSFVQVIWQLDRIIFGTIAGVFADRWNRKRIMVIVNILQALIAGALAVQIDVSGHVSRIAVFSTVFLLNTLNTFFFPSSNAVMPEIVGREALVTAQGLMSTVGTLTNFVGELLAGVVSALGVIWAIGFDAISFLVASVCIALARFPKVRKTSHQIAKHPSFIREIVDGWNTISSIPVIKSMVWLGVLLNVASFVGPLIPGTVKIHLHSGAIVLGAVGAAGVVGATFAGLVAGPIERNLGAGRVFVLGFILSGIARIGFALSTSVPLGLLMSAIWSFGSSVGNVAMGAVEQVVVPEEFRGRVWGITSSLAVSLIPISSLIGGWLADKFGPVPLVSASGLWVIGTALIGLCNKHIRTARI